MEIKKICHVLLIICILSVPAFACAILRIFPREENFSLVKENLDARFDFMSLDEAPSQEKSRSKDWWLSAGGLAYFEKEGFTTNIGSLPKRNAWRKIYAKNNPKDTEKGRYPQNIFRLVFRHRLENFSQSVNFFIVNSNLTESENRNKSNGIFLFNRYQDKDNIYYTGLRVDGSLVIKKKIGGEYYTMARKIFLKNGSGYDRDKNPNLIPQNKWIGIKSEIQDVGENVSIKLFVETDSSWKLLLEAEDSPGKHGDKVFKEGYTGIRSDFMDVRFGNYEVKKF